MVHLTTAAFRRNVMIEMMQKRQRMTTIGGAALNNTKPTTLPLCV
jgi:hypothetical protein